MRIIVGQSPGSGNPVAHLERNLAVEISDRATISQERGRGIAIRFLPPQIGQMGECSFFGIIEAAVGRSPNFPRNNSALRVRDQSIAPARRLPIDDNRVATVSKYLRCV